MSPFSWFNRLFGAKTEKNTPVQEMDSMPALIENTPEVLKFFDRFSEIETCEIMKPRMDIAALSLSSTFDTVMETIRESEYSRLPVYDGDLDHIKGILYIKDLLPYWGKEDELEWKKLIRPAIFVPETKKIEQLLKEFKKQRRHLAIVVDEYGGTSGIVTMEDVLEEVVGEINDEFDIIDEERLYQKTGDGAYIFDGRMPVHDLCKLLDVDDDYFDIESGDYESLAGLILEILGSFPAKGAHVEYKDFIFTVEATGDNRITRIKMVRVHEKE